MFKWEILNKFYQGKNIKLDQVIINEFNLDDENFITSTLCCYTKEVPESLQLFEYLLKEEKYYTPRLMYMTLVNNEIDFLKTLISSPHFKAEDINVLDDDDEAPSPLWYAIKYTKDINTVKLLMENGAEILQPPQYKRYVEEIPELCYELLNNGSSADNIKIFSVLMKSTIIQKYALQYVLESELDYIDLSLHKRQGKVIIRHNRFRTKYDNTNVPFIIYLLDNYGDLIDVNLKHRDGSDLMIAAITAHHNVDLYRKILKIGFNIKNLHSKFSNYLFKYGFDQSDLEILEFLTTETHLFENKDLLVECICNFYDTVKNDNMFTNIINILMINIDYFSCQKILTHVITKHAKGMINSIRSDIILTICKQNAIDIMLVFDNVKNNNHEPFKSYSSETKNKIYYHLESVANT